MARRALMAFLVLVNCSAPTPLPGADAGGIDAGPGDAGSVDAGAFDAGPGDAGSGDAGCVPVCGDGRVECGEVCDFGAGPCCNTTCDGYATGTVCRPAAGVCDLAEVCTGTTGACPADARRHLDVCRPSAGDCDVAEQCDGVSVDCPADEKRPSTTVCRLSVDACDVTEFCTGATDGCPADGLLDAGTTCRAAAGACDSAETCDGLSAACPPDLLVPSGTVCRAAVGTCDLVEVCTGSASSCPGDQLVTGGTVCRPAWTSCDLVESCTGAVGVCPADAWKDQDAGCGPPRVTANVATFNFGDVGLGSSSVKTVILTNDGGLPLISPPTVQVGGATPTDFSTTSRCTGNLRPGTSCDVDVVLAPVTLGPKNAVVTFGTSPLLSASFVGTARSPATLSVAPTVITFAPTPVGQASMTAIVTVMNAPATVVSGVITASVSDPSFVVVPTTGACILGATVLASGSTCTVGLAFTPGSVGSRSAVLTVSASPGGQVTSQLQGDATP